MLALLLLLAAAGPGAGEPSLLAPGQPAAFVDRGLREPFAVDFDAEGRAYVAEMSANRVSVVDPQGRVSVLAGTGEKGLSGDGGPARAARFSSPHHVLVGPDGALYVADTFNNCVRRIDLATSVVTRFAGTGEKGDSGDGGPAADARFGSVYNIAFRGQTLYVADLGNHRVRAVDLASRIVRTVAGNGAAGVPREGGVATEEPLVDPRAVAADPWGNLYICERNGNVVRVVDGTGRIRTVVGTGERGHSGDGGPAREARLDGPKHLFVEANGDVLIADTENHAIRRYSPAEGTIRHVAGGPEGGPSSAGPGGLARPHGAMVRPGSGEIYVSDSGNDRIVRLGRRRRLLAIGAASGWQHESVTDALVALQAIGRESGLWETTARTDVQLVTKEPLPDNARNLDAFDAVFFVTCGELPLDEEQRQSLLRFVREEGKGFLGAHAATVAQWPEYVDMIGGRFESHPWNQIEAVVRVEDGAFPAMRHFAARFRLFDEFYQIGGFSRDRSHVLMSLDLSSVDVKAPGVRETDVPIVWTRSEGRGRVFYSSLGHPPASWGRADMRRMWLEAVKWAMKID